MAVSGTVAGDAGIVPVSSFDIRWPYMVVYATTLFIAITELASVVYAFPAVYLMNRSAGSVSTAGAVGLASLMAIPLIGCSLFVLGRWMGVRSAGAAYWILPLAMVLGRAIDLVLLYFTEPATRSMLSGVAHSPAALAGVCVLFLILLGIGCLGIWRGNRVRFGAYFNSLLKQVSGPTRDTLLAMTYEEAKAAGPARIGV